MRAPILAGALLVSSAAWSQEGPYVGLGLGMFDYEEDVFGSPYFSDTAPAYKLFGGYRFNRRWAVEGYLGTTAILKEQVTISTPARIDFDIREIRGLAHFGSFLAGIGFRHVDFSTSPMLAGPSSSKFSLIVGGEWSKRKWDFRVEAEAFNTDDRILLINQFPFEQFPLEHSTQATSLSFGALYKFGGH